MKRSPMAANITGGGPMILHAPVFSDLPWLVHGFTTRLGGVSRFDGSAAAGHDLNLGKAPWDKPKNVLENRRRMLSELRANGLTLVTLRQLHSDMIRVAGPIIPRAGDGLITNRPGLLLSILAADCLLLLIADTKQRVVAAVHCGWRGTARAIAQKTVGLMRMSFGSRLHDLRAAIGPGIRVCCYKVGPEVKGEFEGQFPYAKKLFSFRNEPPSPLEEKYPRLFKTYKSPGFRTFHEPGDDTRQMYLDLVLANVMQLQEAGISRGHIWSQTPCTSCHPELFFSHRRDSGRTGRMMGVIGIRAMDRQQTVSISHRATEGTGARGQGTEKARFRAATVLRSRVRTFGRRAVRERVFVATAKRSVPWVCAPERTRNVPTA